MADFTVKGGPETLRALDALKQEIALRVTRAALRQAMRTVAGGATAVIPARTGRLLKSARISVGTDDKGFPAGRFSIGDRGAYYAGFVERGTKPHIIVASKARALFFGGGKPVRAVQHPGAKAQHVMERLMDGKAQQAIDVLMTEMDAGIAKAARKIGNLAAAQLGGVR